MTEEYLDATTQVGDLISISNFFVLYYIRSFDFNLFIAILFNFINA